ncbi:MAG: glycosyltransferase family 39 protein [Acidimicrobiia bacterium]|nr:glycosyltransferase family 39 protein [Acidimicrobiia bacterium]
MRFRARRLLRLAPVLVATVAFGLCIWAPGPVTVTSDEPNWLARSEQFRHALAQGDLHDANAILPATLIQHQTSPGVTTMWAGTIGHGLVRLGQRVGLVDERPEGPRTEQVMLRAGRGVVSFFCAVALGLFMWVSSRLVGRRVALVAGALLACEPFLIGHAGVLHTDALVTLWGATSIAAFASALADRRWHRPSLVLSAVAAALACLTKVNATVLIAGAVVVLLLASSLARRARGGSPAPLRSRVAGIGAWSGIAAAVFVALWPAMWVAPIRSLRQCLDAFGQAESTDRTYFRGVTTNHPGPAYYPVAIVMRATPWLVVLGLAGLVVMTTSALTKRSGARAEAISIGALIVAPVPYLAAISLPAQRYDRYALPVFPFMALAAGVAVVALASALRVQRGWLVPIGLAVLAVPLLLERTMAPYEISYVDPLIGQKRAQHWILLGWDEGIERLGSDIDRREHRRCDDIDVLVFNQALAIAVPCGRLDGAGRPRSERRDFEYAIHYISQRQRGQFDNFYDPIERHGTLVDSVRIGGVDYADLWRVGRRR